jgi:hypothetical protein
MFNKTNKIMSLFDSASLTVTPNGVKEGKLYSIKPTNGSGDLNVVRATTATRVNSDGLIESVATNVPRLDYSNGSCPSILVEPQRTNLLLRSEEFDNGSWIKTNSTIIANDTTSPNGTFNADKIIPLSTASKNILQNSSVTLGQLYTYSVFAKKGEYDFLQIIMDSTGFSGSEDWFNVNLTNGTFGNQIISNITNKTITSLTNGWYKITVTKAATSTTSSGRIIFSPLNSDYNSRLHSYTSDGTSGIYLWGAQLEAGSNATSYIPTVASISTRNQDVISKTGISNLIGQTEGTLYAEVDLSIQSEAGLFRRILMISNGTETYSTYLRVTSGNIVQLVSFDGTIQAVINSISSISGNVKIAATYKTNEFKLYINGVLQGTDLLGSIPATRNILRIGNSDALVSTHNLNDRIKSVVLYKTALTDQECINLTTI